MARSYRLVFVLAMLLADISGAAEVGKGTLVSIQTPRGATQAFILIKCLTSAPNGQAGIVS